MATRQVVTGYTTEQGHNEPVYTTVYHECCGECGMILDTREAQSTHRHNGHLVNTGVVPFQEQTGTRYVVDVPGGQSIYGTESYVDYYVCSECGQIQ